MAQVGAPAGPAALPPRCNAMPPGQNLLGPVTRVRWLLRPPPGAALEDGTSRRLTTPSPLPLEKKRKPAAGGGVSARRPLVVHRLDGKSPVADPVSAAETMWRGPRNRRARARRRKAAHGPAAERARHEAITFSGANTVRPGTYEQYARAEAAFRTWLKGRRRLRKPLKTEIDRLLEEYMVHLYFGGATAGEGSPTLAALEYFGPSLADHLPMTRRALRGFRRLAPGGSRAPLPFVGLMILVGSAMSRHAPLMGIAYLLGFYAYLRPVSRTELEAGFKADVERGGRDVPSPHLYSLLDGQDGQACPAPPRGVKRRVDVLARPA